MAQVKLLSDKPTIEDNFTHDVVATAITSLLLEEDGGKTIALKGGWGSGKSSIVEMVKNKLEKKCNVFVFDAWAHEGDPLRRSFLESLISFCISKNLIDTNKWKERIEVLRNRKETTTTKDFVEFTIPGIIISVFALLTPFGLVVLSLWPSLPMAWLQVGILLSLAPFVIIIAIIIVVFFFYPKGEKKKIISLFINQTDKTVTTNTSKTPDPTSIEFQETFLQLLEELFHKNESKLLIVIDNLDRIEHEDALKIWATMRTFFDFGHLKEKEWQKKVWLLVPYDYTGIKRILHNATEEDNGCIVSSFTNKTFQITFETPPAILSDSSKYFKEQLELCLGKEVDSEEVHKIYRIFKALRGFPSSPITPREIKIFINNLSALVRENWSEIPLHILALYSALKTRLPQEEFIAHLQNPRSEKIDKSILDLIDSNYREYLAALLFKVEPSKALSALLKEKIESALINSDIDPIQKGQFLPGFTEVFDELLSERLGGWVVNEPQILTQTALCLNSLTIGEDSYLNNCWTTVQKNLNNIKEWRSLKKPVTDGLFILLEQKLSRQIIINITKSFSNSPYLFQAQNAANNKLMLKRDGEVLEQLEEVFRLIDWLSRNEHTDIIEKYFKINATEENYIMLLNILSELNTFSHLFTFFKTSNSEEEIVKLIASKIERGLIESNITWNALHLFYKIYYNINYQSIIEAAAENLGSVGSSHSPDELYLLIKLLLHTSKNNGLALSSLKRLTLDGAIPNHFHNAYTKAQNYEAAAICLLCIIKFSPDGRLDNSPGNSRAGINEFKNIKANPLNYEGILLQYISLLKEFNEVGSLLYLSELGDSFDPLIKQIIKLICEKESPEIFFSSQEIITHEKLFFNSLNYGETYHSLVNVFIKEKGLVNEITNREFSATLSSLYLCAIKNLNYNHSPFIEYLIAGLNKMTLPDFKEELDKEHTNVFDLIIDLVKNNKPLCLKSPLEELLVSEVENFISDNTIHDTLKDNWTHIISALDANHKGAFLGNMKHKITNLDENLSELFNLFDEILLDGQIFMDDINNVINIGFKNLVNRNNLSEVIWLNRFFTKNPTIMKTCKTDYAVTFKDLIKHKKNDVSLDSSLREQYAYLAKTLKIKEK